VFQCLIVEIGGWWPDEIDLLGEFEVAPYSGSTDAATRGDLPDAEFEFVTEPENLPDFPHGDSLSRHVTPFEGQVAIGVLRGAGVALLRWVGWPESCGISGPFHFGMRGPFGLESLAHYTRNMQGVSSSFATNRNPGFFG
jgi:hypothetical protein